MISKSQFCFGGPYCSFRYDAPHMSIYIAHISARKRSWRRLLLPLPSGNHHNHVASYRCAAKPTAPNPIRILIAIFPLTASHYTWVGWGKRGKAPCPRAQHVGVTGTRTHDLKHALDHESNALTAEPPWYRHYKHRPIAPFASNMRFWNTMRATWTCYQQRMKRHAYFDVLWF